MSLRMKLRSSVPPEEKEKQAELQQLLSEVKLNRPLLTYNGKIVYANTIIDCAIACDKLLDMVNWTIKKEFIVGFDMEWPFTYQTGSGKTALIQISPNLDICYLLHVTNLKKLPTGLYEFLHNSKVKLTGVNIKNDIRKLCRDFDGFQVDKILENAIDSGVMANTILPFTQRWSMQKLVDYVLKKKINKDNKVRMSKWNLIPLLPIQKTYAATDGYTSLLLYQELLKLKLKLDEEKHQDSNHLNREENSPES